MTATLTYQLAAAGLLLVMVCIAALTLMHVDQRRHKFQARIEQYASPYARVITYGLHEPPRTAIGITGKRTLRKFLAWAVGFDPSRRDTYPIAWWIVLPAALLMARGLVAIAEILLGGVMLLALPVIWLLIVRRFYRWCETRRLRWLYEQFPDALAMLVRAVRVGIPLSEGIRNVAAESPDPTGQVFRLVVDKIAVGGTLQEALHDLAEQNPVAEYRFFSNALALQSETGGAVSETLERLADVIRKRVTLREHARALASEARTSIAILAALPVFTSGALALLSPDYISLLFTDPQGHRILAMAIISLTLGIVTMQTIVNRSLS